jgi:hypothetical protein
MKKRINKSYCISLIINILIILLIVRVMPSFGVTYYFSVSGNDSNDGLSESTPKQSLTAASGLINAGNTIRFKRGDKWYCPTYVWNFSDKKGTSSNPILIDTYGSGPKPIIACMELMDSGWVDEGSIRWSHSLDGYTDVRRCFVYGLSRKKVSSPDSVDNIHKFAVASNKIYIYSASRPAYVEVINNDTSLAVLRLANCSYITFKNLDFRGGGRWCAIEVKDRSSHITFDSCIVQRISMYGIQFLNNTKNYSWYHESPVVRNCYLNMGWTAQERNPNKSYGGDGINFRSAVQNGLVQHNTVVDFQHTGIAAELCDSPDYTGVLNNVFECNEVYSTAPGYCHGFDCQGIEGKCTGNIFRRNYFHDITNSGHLLGNNNYIYSNIFANIDKTTTGKTIQAYAVDMMPFTQSGMVFISKNNVLVNNTIYDTENSGIRVGGETTVYENDIKNNIILKWTPPDSIWKNYGLRNDGTFQPQIVENNCIYNFGQTVDKVIRQDTSCYTVQEADEAFSNYNHNIQAAPMFTNPDNGDFRLLKDSPCKRAGQVLSGLDNGFADYFGNAWHNPPSIGAIQYKPTDSE